MHVSQSKNTPKLKDFFFDFTLSLEKKEENCACNFILCHEKFKILEIVLHCTERQHLNFQPTVEKTNAFSVTLHPPRHAS